MICVHQERIRWSPKNLKLPSRSSAWYYRNIECLPGSLLRRQSESARRDMPCCAAGSPNGKKSLPSGLMIGMSMTDGLPPGLEFPGEEEFTDGYPDHRPSGA